MPASKLQDSLAYPPRGMRASRAAAYVGMSETTFLALVEEGQLPKPLHIKGMRIWDRYELDLWFERFKPEPDKPRQRNTFDERYGINSDDDRS
jgi:predicted DNA-binding transcriptional regulator AlpA